MGPNAAIAEGNSRSKEMKMIHRRTDRIHDRSPVPPLEWKNLPQRHFDLVASVLLMRFYFILMSDSWCCNIACSAHKCLWCERQTFLDLFYMPNSESMPGISITPFKYLHRESRDGPTWVEERSARRGKVQFPRHFPCLIQIRQHVKHPAKPGNSLPEFPDETRAAGARSFWIKVME